jgi:hypothetical protein
MHYCTAYLGKSTLHHVFRKYLTQAPFPSIIELLDTIYPSKSANFLFIPRKRFFFVVFSRSSSFIFSFTFATKKPLAMRYHSLHQSITIE